MLERLKRTSDSLGAARAAAASVGDYDRDLRERHAAATRRLPEIANSPESVDVVVRAAHAAVDEIAARYTGRQAAQTVGAFSRRIRVRDDGAFAVAPADGAWQPAMSPSWEHLCWLSPSSVKAALEAAIRAHDQAPGLPIEERPAALRAVQAEIRAIEDEHEALVDEAARHGITVTHLPAVAERLERAKRKRESEGHGESHRRQLTDRVNQTYSEPRSRLVDLNTLNTQPRVGRSKYLQGIEG